MALMVASTRPRRRRRERTRSADAGGSAGLQGELCQAPDRRQGGGEDQAGQCARSPSCASEECLIGEPGRQPWLFLVGLGPVHGQLARAGYHRGFDRGDLPCIPAESWGRHVGVAAL